MISKYNFFSVILFLLSLFTIQAQGLDIDSSPLGQHRLDQSQDIDHTLFYIFLTKYVNTQHPSGIHLVRYSLVSRHDRQLLKDYITHLANQEISNFHRKEQLPFWINLYNALIIDIILSHYPIRSIEEISFDNDILSWGPWDAELVKIEGVGLSLNDIRHGILMSVWKDPRIHYLLCNGSVSSPDIHYEPFTSDSIEELLNDLPRNYINHVRGMEFVDGRLTLSSMYNWYMNDFGGTETRIKEHLGQNVSPTARDRIHRYSGTIGYRWDWNLNGD